MSAASDATDREARYIERVLVDLRADEARHMDPPIEKRKLRTVTRECGLKKASRAFLKRLQERANNAGLYSEPPLDDAGLRPDDWIFFSSGPIPPDAMMFSREEDLRQLVEACLGNGVFRNLELYKEAGSITGHEYRLPNGARIDLLCQERTKSGSGALVAMELKRDRERGTVDQMVDYLDALKKYFPQRKVRGIIISGREDRVGSALLKQVDGYEIDWYCYHADFEKLEIK